MKITSLIHRDVTSCTIHDDLAYAAQQMWDHDIGCLPVIDDQGHIAGMITDRDICMAAFTSGKPLSAIPVTEPMTRDVFACTADDEVAAVEQAMRDHQIRRMPVIDPHGHPVGMVSINDLARASTAGKVEANEIAYTLAAVTSPRPIT